MWVSRYTLLPDGMAYLDLARAWLRGDWPQALNSYWSPLYVWMLAVATGLGPAGPRWELLAGHLINFAGFLLSVFAGELLLREWAGWQGPPRHPRLIAFAAYLTLTWAGLHLVNLNFDSADILVMAGTLYVAALLVRVQRNAADRKDFVLLGLVLGAGFLAKAADAVLIPVTLALLAALTRSVSSTGIRITAAVCTLVCVPFVGALSLAKHRFVYSDTGWVNYSLVVSGQSLEGYKDSVQPPPPAAPHPFVVRHSDPRVISFENHVTGTFPVHTDPSWWAAGYPVTVDFSRQAMVLRKGIRFTLVLLAGNPALWLLVIAALAGAARRRELRFRQSWFLALLALAATAPYWIILVHSRYIAGPLALAGFVFIAAVWRVRLSAASAKVACAAMTLAVCAAMWIELASVPFYLAGEAFGFGAPPDRANVELVESMKRQGLRPGDRVAYIGISLGATWLALTGAQVTAIVPTRIFHDESKLGRPYDEDFAGTDGYWQSNAAQRDEVLRAFRESGAQWVLANEVPPGADVSGWAIAGQTHHVRPAGCRIHDLRHTAITRLAETGVSDATLMAIVGHMSRRMLEHYSHIRIQAKRVAMDALSTPTLIARQNGVPAIVPTLSEDSQRRPVVS